jgi:hypothetical protein
VKGLDRVAHLTFRTTVGVGVLLAVAAPVMLWRLSRDTREEILLRYGGAIVAAEVIDVFERSATNERDAERSEWGVVYRFRTADGRLVTGSRSMGSGRRPGRVGDVELPTVVHAEYVRRFPEINRLRFDRDLLPPWSHWPEHAFLIVFLVLSPAPGVSLIRRGLR